MALCTPRFKGLPKRPVEPTSPPVEVPSPHLSSKDKNSVQDQAPHHIPPTLARETSFVERKTTPTPKEIQLQGNSGDSNADESNVSESSSSNTRHDSDGRSSTEIHLMRGWNLEEYHAGQNDYRYRSEIKSKTIGLYQITDVTDLY